MTKPSVRKLNGKWTVTRPGYGFCPPSVDEFDSAKEAWSSLRSSLASGAPSAEKGFYTLYTTNWRGLDRPRWIIAEAS